MKLVLRALFVLLAFPILSFADWPPISPDDLKMTSVKEHPGAPAMVLDREEIDDDMNNYHSVYERIKILTDAGRKYADVELPYRRRGFTISGISGRTVHADGAVVEFTGKPFDKTVEKGAGTRINVKSFTLPDVQVGSIIEYRYNLRYNDNMVLPPHWYVQNDLFQRKAYFKFIPFQNHGMVEIRLPHDQIARGIAWAPFLGSSAHPEIHNVPSSTVGSVHQVNFWVDLNLSDIPPFIEEPYMPPKELTRWRVYFYYQQDVKPDDYWKTQGKYWNKDVEGFLDKKRGITEALSQIVLPADVPEDKVKKIYAFVGKLENQDFIPERSAQEEKTLRLKRNDGAQDVLENKSGSHDDLNRLFVAMVRAAGIPASLVWVPDRRERVFVKEFLSTAQFDAEIAIVQLDGKDVFLDPGTKFCPYGIVDWHYTGVDGLRQGANGAEVGRTPGPIYSQSVVTRNASLALDSTGTASGTVALMFKGLRAMSIRQEGGKTDAAGRKKLLEDTLRESLPGNAEISLTSSPDWDNIEPPLVAQFHVSFPMAIAAGKRLMLMQHIFQVNEKPRFPAAQRTNMIYFHIPWQEADEVHIKIPAGMEVESLAPEDALKLPYAWYQVRQKQEAPDKIYSRRDFIMGQAVFTTQQYKEIKDFFDKVKADDDQPALVKISQNVATK